MRVEDKLNNHLQTLVTNHCREVHNSEANFKTTEFYVNKDQTYLLFSLDNDINCDLESSIEIGGKSLNV